ncbi:hypothetical protein RHGRI_021398 [Rhododendron griersonianum]|uniref:Uncharacterized protein n=1 Tax=Rhododendron griersonianum TaxID=479676 RepID=A0AAV6JK26_9ERIC|nr:hypothetical protein RHGRI_021398 [Rhododendron griersonianum]
MATESRVPFILAAIASAIPVFLSGYYLTHTVILFIRGDPDCSHPCTFEIGSGFHNLRFPSFPRGIDWCCMETEAPPNNMHGNAGHYRSADPCHRVRDERLTW